MTAPTDSRLGAGTLTLGTTDFGAQASNVMLVPTHTSEDGTPTLGDPDPAPLVVTKWALKGNAVQDWAADAGLIEYCRTNSGDTVVFEWVPNTAEDVTYSGSCQVLALEFGGDVGKRNTTAFEFPVVGDLDRTVTP